MSLIKNTSIAVGVVCLVLLFVTQAITCTKGISSEDYQILNSFFQRLVSREDFGYVIFGDKPVALTGYFDPLPAENVGSSRGNQILKDGWSVWKKHRSSASVGKFFFFEERDPNDPSLYNLVIINKSAFLQVVQKHLVLFQEVLKRQISPEEILRNVVEKKNLYGALNGHEGLVGIVLGYGQTNAFLYHRRFELNICKTIPYFSLKQELPSKGFISVEEERRFIEEKLKTIDENNSVLYPILLPQFLGISHSEETQELLTSYRNVRIEIMKIFPQERFLDAIASQFGVNEEILSSNK